jgi:hypothetical protein
MQNGPVILAVYSMKNECVVTGGVHMGVEQGE